MKKKRTVRVYLHKKGLSTPDGQTETEKSKALLLAALLSYCTEKGLPRDLEVGRGKWGKPYLLNRDDVFFSVSHTKNWWLCAVSNVPVGVDIEEADRRISRGVAKRWFHKDEQEYLDRIKEGKSETETEAEAQAQAAESLERECLLKIWVRKEAYVKLIGTALTREISKFSVVDATGFLRRVQVKENEDEKTEAQPKTIEYTPLLLKGCEGLLVGVICTRCAKQPLTSR